MKPKVVVASIFALVAALTLALVILGRDTASRTSERFTGQIFQVHGQVRGVNPRENILRIAHEEIPGYMPAMTMPLTVKDPALLQNLAVGDEIQFELRVTTNDSWISRITRWSGEPSPSQTASGQTVAGNSSLSRPTTRPTGEGRGEGLSQAGAAEDRDKESLHSGETVPDFALIDQDGHSIHLSDFRGKAVLLTFIYTRCPLPNFCPLMSKNFADLEQRFGKEFPNKYHLLSISIDPEFDRPEVLKDYSIRQGADPKDWSFAVGDTDSLNFVAGLMGLYFEKQGGLISHDLRTALIGPDGRLVQTWKSNVWTPYEVQRRVREVLTGHADMAAR